MTRRPDPFNKTKLEEALLELGCPESFLSTTISNYRLFIPLVLAELGEERVFELVYAQRDAFELGEQETAWRTSVKYIVAWAEQAIEHYKHKRGNRPPEPRSDPDQNQPRLF